MANSEKAKSWPKHFAFAYSQGGSDAPIIEWITAASTIEKGMPVALNSGQVEEATATSGQLYGIANNDAESGDDVMVYVGHPDNVFVGQTDGDHSSKNPPFVCDIVQSGTEWRIDFGNNDEDVVNVIKKVPGDDDSDTTDPGRVYFQIHRSSYDNRMGEK